MMKGFHQIFHLGPSFLNRKFLQENVTITNMKVRQQYQLKYDIKITLQYQYQRFSDTLELMITFLDNSLS